MAFNEDMSVFFSDDEFAVVATFVPSTGGAAQSAAVIFDVPTETTLGGEVLTDEPAITYPATELPSIRAGDNGVIEGVQYRVREVMRIQDGKLKMARLMRL